MGGATDVWPWLGLVGLGAFHGLNPAMGWLFAVALGLQHKRKRGWSRFSRRVKYLELWGRGGRAARLTRAAPNVLRIRVAPRRHTILG